MKEVKFFEIRDDGTLIPAMALRVDPATQLTDEESYLWARGGWGKDQTGTYLIPLKGGLAQYNASKWNQGYERLFHAHEYIKRNWDSLTSGAVIDIEFICGETTTPKISDRLSPIGAF